MVITFKAVYLKLLHRREIYVEAGALHPVFGDDKVVVDFGAKNNNSISTGTAVNADRRVDVVLDMIVACTAAYLCVS